MGASLLARRPENLHERILGVDGELLLLLLLLLGVEASISRMRRKGDGTVTFASGKWASSKGRDRDGRAESKGQRRLAKRTHHRQRQLLLPLHARLVERKQDAPGEFVSVTAVVHARPACSSVRRPDSCASGRVDPARLVAANPGPKCGPDSSALLLQHRQPERHLSLLPFRRGLVCARAVKRLSWLVASSGVARHVRRPLLLPYCHRRLPRKCSAFARGARGLQAENL